jgi:D-beta-D-heptose 7-phosphate kinase / D-beta-D-heptose 1-phosphate adenosyltransferase
VLHLREALSAFGRQRVLVVGDLILDEYVTGDCSRVSPEAPVPIVRVGGRHTVLGGAANTAANIASLGGNVTLIGLVGEDAGGDELRQGCAAANIQLAAVTSLRPTTRKVRVVGEQQQLLRLDYEDTAPVDEAIESRLLAALEAELARARIVVLSDYAKGAVTRRVCQELLARAHAAGKKVIVDPRPQHRSFYAGCDYLTPNWKESQALLGHPESHPTDESILASGRELVATFNSHVVMTLGGRGISFFGRQDDEYFSVPTVAREVFDVSGAGDTVVAALALALAAGCSHVEAVGLANLAAGVVVAKRGTATVSPHELLRDADADSRIVDRDELRKLAARLTAQSKRIVTVNGSFDLLHAGHVHFLREARQQGDVLIVGLNSDASVRSYKGPSRPVVPERQRAEMLLAVRYVDYVHLFDETEPMRFIEDARPAVHVNGAEYGERCIEAETVRRIGARLHLVDRLPGLSTTELLQRIES